MPPPKTYRAEGLVLKNVSFGEADLLVTLCSREWGKVRAVAKGVKRTNSKMVGHFEPLTVVRLALARGRTLDVVNQGEVAENFGGLKSDLPNLTKGLYVAELVDGFGSEGSANPPLYQLALDTLANLERTPGDDLALRYFELHLLRVSGFMPELFHCVECRSPLEPEKHRFSPDAGGTLCLDCHPPNVQVRTLSLRTLKVLRLLNRSRADSLPRLELPAPLAKEVGALLESTVLYWLDREIRSNSFLRHLERAAPVEIPS